MTSAARLVLVPGLGLAAEVYEGLAAALRPLPLGVLPLPGYGLPARPGTALGPPELARRLLGEAERQESGTLVLVGHSASCQVVAEAAAAAPERVRGLVLVGPTTDPRAAGWPRLLTRWTATAARERPGQVPGLLRVYARTGPGSMRRAMDAARRHDVRAPLSRSESALLVLRGRHDHIAPQDWADAVAGAGRGRALGLPVGAHMIPVTHPQHVAALVRPWLGEQGLTTGA